MKLSIMKSLLFLISIPFTGVIDIQSYFEVLPRNLTVFVEIYDESKENLLAGAKFILDSVKFPVRFQLFSENILSSRSVWIREAGRDQQVVVRVCDVERIESCLPQRTYFVGEAVSKVVQIGGENEEKRFVRAFPYIRVQPTPRTLSLRN